MSSYSVKSVFASAPNTERGKQTRLTTSPNGEEYVYASGQRIIIRNARNPMIADVYCGHKAKCTVGRISPSGYYCASADIQGQVMIWDTTNKQEHILKYQKQSFSGGVFDLCWTEDSKRVGCVGNGKEHKAEVFMFDSGSSVGEITGHTSTVLACSMRQKRPYRFVTSGEDSLVNFYKGPPFKYDHSNREHARFVNTVEYSPDSEMFASGGGDKRIFLYDGSEGQLLGELKADEDNKNVLLGGGHKMSVISLAWTRDGQHIFSASTDKTVKLWDVASRKYLRTFAVRPAADVKEIELADTPCGVTCTNYGAVVCTLRGDLATFDERVSEAVPVSILRAHNRAVESLHIIDSAAASSSTEDEKLNRVDFITSADDGQVIEYNIERGQKSGTAGFIHQQRPIIGAVESNGVLVSLGMDDKVAFSAQTQTSSALVFDSTTSPSSEASSSSSPSLTGFVAPAFPAPQAIEVKQPRHLSLVNNGTEVAVLALTKLSIFPVAAKADNAPIVQITLPYEATSIATHKSQNIIAVGGNDQLVHFYKYDPAAKSVTEYATSKSKYSGVITALALSPCGNLFAAARDRYLCVGPTSLEELSKGAECKLQENRLLHTAKITTLDFSPDSKLLLSGGIDCQVFVWDVEDPEKFEKYVSVNAPLGVTQAKWIDQTRFLTVGPDAIIKLWSK